MDVTLNSVSIVGQVVPQSLKVEQQLTNEPDTAQFSIFQVAARGTPTFNDNIVIFDGATKIFAGKVAEVSEAMAGAQLPILKIHCVDHTFEFDRVLASKTYSSQTIQAIISDLVSTYASGFTATNVTSGFIVEKIVFNQVPLSVCIRRLADIVRSDWYIDEDKDVHFFQKFTNTAAYNLTDTAGNHIYNSLIRSYDGSQVVNRVKVRGGEYNGDTYSDVIEAQGTPLSFVLPYKFANLSIETNTGTGYVAEGMGIDFLDDFGGTGGTSITVLYNFQTQSFRYGTPLAQGTLVRFTGNPKVPVLAIAEDGPSVVTYGTIEKIIRDNSIESNTVARKRAAAELTAFTEPIVDAKFETYTAGLRTGMLINVASANRNFDDNLIIKKITFSPRTNTTYQYKVECISTQRYTLLDLLRKILTPDAQPGDEKETSEEIFAVTETIDFADVWTNVSPYQITETVTFADVYITIDAGTINWVYGPYAPVTHSDPNRQGRYNRDSIYA